MKLSRGFSLGVLSALSLAALAATTGTSSRPRFQSLGVGVAAPATAGSISASGVNHVLTASDDVTISAGGASGDVMQLNAFTWDVAANNSVGISTADVGSTIQLDSSGDLQIAAATAVSVVGSSFTFNSAVVPTETTGTFVATFDDGCTTSPTINFKWYRVGSVTQMRASASSGFPCTSDSTNFATTGAPVPAGARPGVGGFDPATGVLCGFTNNGAATGAIMRINNSGNVSFDRVDPATLSSAGWTNSGSKSVASCGLIAMSLTFGLT